MLSPAELDRLRVVLVSTRNPLNIGAAARAMSNFGVMRLRVVNPYDEAFREARSAVAAAPLLQKAEKCTSVADAVADCSLVLGTTAARARELHQPLRSIDEASADIRKYLSTGNVALMFGSEKRGLLREELSHCHWLLHIPTRDEHSSMNLGQSVAVCLYELIRDSERPTAPAPERRRASAADLERITEQLIVALETSGYTQPRTAQSTAEKVRRLTRRINLDGDDAELLTGMLRQINHELTRKK